MTQAKSARGAELEVPDDGDGNVAAGPLRV